MCPSKLPREGLAFPQRDKTVGRSAINGLLIQYRLEHKRLFSYVVKEGENRALGRNRFLLPWAAIGARHNSKERLKDSRNRRSKQKHGDLPFFFGFATA